MVSEIFLLFKMIEYKCGILIERTYISLNCRQIVVDALTKRLCYGGTVLF